MNWDDLRIVRAVFRSGSYAAAAKRLGINETTVSRRLSRFEDQLGAALFDAADGARRPTEYCHNVVAIADEMATQLEQISGDRNSDKPALSVRRISATDSVAVGLLEPDLASFLQEHPHLAVDFRVSTENVDFARWGADLAIRLKRPRKGNFLISKLGEIPLYFVEPANRMQDDEIAVCAYPDDLSDTPESEYLAALGLLKHARCRTKNLLLMKPLIQESGFCGVLPGYLCGDLFSNPAFAITPLPQSRSAWLLTQTHLKRDAASRIVSDWIRERFALMR